MGMELMRLAVVDVGEAVVAERPAKKPGGRRLPVPPDARICARTELTSTPLCWPRNEAGGALGMPPFIGEMPLASPDSGDANEIPFEEGAILESGEETG